MALGPLLGDRPDSYGQRVNDVPALPSGPLAAASLSLVQATVNAPIAGHSIRTFLYARLLAGHDGRLNDAAYDEDLLFAACIMHDLGLGRLAPGQARFEVEGADLAAALLTEHGIAAPDVDRVWEAIALHSSVGIAHRRGLLTYLTHRGVFIDAGRDTGIPAGLIQRVRTAYPHRAGRRYLADAIADHAARSEAAAPPGSLGFELLRQRRAEAGLERCGPRRPADRPGRGSCRLPSSP
jgi:HD domain